MTAQTADKAEKIDGAETAQGAAPEEDGGRRRLTRREKRERRREQKRLARELAARKKEARKQIRSSRKSLAQAARSEDKMLVDQQKKARRRRAWAKDVYTAVGFDAMFEDGTCQVERGLYSQTVSFDDVSYQAASVEDQRAMLNTYVGLHNSMGPDVTLQWSVLNLHVPEDEIGKRKFFAVEGPASAYAEEYNRILNDKMLEGHSNIVRSRYLTYSCAADSYEDALPLLTAIRSTVSGPLRKLGCSVRRENGKMRAETIAAVLAAGTPREVDYGVLAPSGLTVKDLVCPQAIERSPDGDKTCLKIDGKHFQTLVISGLGSAITDRSLSSIIDLPIPLLLSWHIQPRDPATTADFVNERLGYIDMDMVVKQQKAAQQGVDPRLAVPQELGRSKQDAEDLLNDILYNSERLFMWSGVVLLWADTAEELRANAVQVVRAAHVQGIEVKALPSQQIEGLNSALPLGNFHLHVKKMRNVTSTQAGLMMPFATLELSEEGGGYYGQNKLSGNLILMNRRRLAAPMGFVLGLPGSGKSFFVKREITNSYLQNPDDEFIVIDPKNEYPPLVEALGGNVVELPRHCVNIFDVYEGTEHVSGSSPASLKSGTLLAISDQILSTETSTITPEQRGVIDRCVRLVFDRFADSSVAPTLKDFYDILKEQPEACAKSLVTAYELYVEGGLSYFNGQTSFAETRRITSFSFKGLSDGMKVFAMLVILDWVYTRTLYNYERGVRTWLYIDEVQSLFSHDAVVSYFDKFWSEGRAWGLIPTGITQTVGRLVRHETAQNLIRTSGYLALLRQSDIDRAQLAEILGLSPQQEGYISTEIDDGDGLLVAGKARVGFTDNFPKGKLYDLWNTKPDEVGQRKAYAWAKQSAARGEQE